MSRPTQRYCYEHQAWIIDGKVSRCGHQDPSEGFEAQCALASLRCYPCAHEGEIHPADCTGRDA